MEKLALAELSSCPSTRVSRPRMEWLQTIRILSPSLSMDNELAELATSSELNCLFLNVSSETFSTCFDFWLKFASPPYWTGREPQAVARLLHGIRRPLPNAGNSCSCSQDCSRIAEHINAKVGRVIDSVDMDRAIHPLVTDPQRSFLVGLRGTICEYRLA